MVSTDYFLRVCLLGPMTVMQGATADGATCGTSNTGAGGRVIWDSSFASGCCDIAAYFELSHGIAEAAKKLSKKRGWKEKMRQFQVL